MSEANKAVALEFLRAMSEGDAEAQGRCLTPDAETLTKGFGKVSGRRDAATMLATVDAFRKIVPTGFRSQGPSGRG